MRSGVLFGVFEESGDRSALAESLEAYRVARAAWAELADRGKVYVSDITVGELPHLRGHWLDRLAAMDTDIALMARTLDEAKPGAARPNVADAIKEALGRPARVTVACEHTPPARFRPGQPLNLELKFATPPASVRVYYRHVNQAERYESVEMERSDRSYRDDSRCLTDSAYPLEYYFEVK
jgi:hypothetical protein